MAVALSAQSAQAAAPFNDSIRVADLKADLFFLAGDGFKGRLVGTPENALAAEFVRSRFERAGLKPGAPNGSFVQINNLMIATLGDRQPPRGDRRRTARASTCAASRTSTRSASAPAARSRRRSSTRASASTRRSWTTTTTAIG